MIGGKRFFNSLELRGFWYLQRDQRRLCESESLNLLEKREEKTKNKIVISGKKNKSIILVKVKNLRTQLTFPSFIVLIASIGYIGKKPSKLPDVSTMWQLAWIVVIPCALIVIPIWVMMDSGVVTTKKIKGVQFEAVNLASSPLYKVIKGYAGIGFVYNLIIMIVFWVTPVIQRGIFDMAIIIQIISPLIAAGSAFPGAMILEYYKPRIRTLVEKTLIKLDMNKNLVYNVELKDRISK
ncbi:MAG: hypothetical protein ACTSO8_05180 [Promethearchaeota archaeon]